MIWTRGEIVADHDLKISVLDRTFEHGLGLFETFRTWNGHATLLDRHLARMRNSAKILGLSLDPLDLPDVTSVSRLIEGEPDDRMLRITMSGGTAGGGSIVWMRAFPLPPAAREPGIDVIRMEIADEPLARHKTLNYWSRRLSYEQALAAGADEALRITPDGLAWSGSRTNLFSLRDGTLFTPGLNGPIVPGILREVVLNQARISGMDVREEDLSMDDLRASAELFLTNAVRGILPVASLEGRKFDAPGPVTNRLREEIRAWLHRGGIEP